MTRRLFLMACCLLLAATPTPAQSGGAKAKPDPISGTWTGELLPQGRPRPIPVTMELKYDGKSAVTGTVTGMPNPADVKGGTFDSKSGALKLPLGKTSDSAVLLVLEGTVAKGKATGHFTGEEGGDFTLTKKP